MDANKCSAPTVLLHCAGLLSSFVRATPGGTGGRQRQVDKKAFLSHFLDELARAVATPMPRSRALRTIGGAIALAAVPALRARPAMARPTSRRHATCEQKCPQPTPVVCNCDRSAEFPNNPAKPCFHTCGVPGCTCCCYPDAKGHPTGANCCPPGYRCGRQGEQSCVCLNTCGSGCCDPTKQDCVGRGALAQCLPKCKQNEERCDRVCCKTNEECDRIRVGTNSVGQCVPKCPAGRARCGPAGCCPPKWFCHNRQAGVCRKCPPRSEECGTKCCNTSQRCCGHDLCCQHGRDCCTVGGTRTCCAANTKCAPQILAGNIGLTAGSTLVCCPKDRLHANPNLCCPPGQKALPGRGIRVGPGLSPFCCPNDQVCGSTCCQKSAVLGSETCCGGKCVDTRFDARNCGSCGNVCDSGVCRDGICAFN